MSRRSQPRNQRFRAVLPWPGPERSLLPRDRPWVLLQVSSWGLRLLQQNNLKRVVSPAAASWPNTKETSFRLSWDQTDAYKWSLKSGIKTETSRSRTSRVWRQRVVYKGATLAALKRKGENRVRKWNPTTYSEKRNIARIGRNSRKEVTVGIDSQRDIQKTDVVRLWAR